MKDEHSRVGAGQLPDRASHLDGSPLLEQLQGHLRLGVGLSQNRRRGLYQDLRPGELGRLKGEVRIPNPGFGCRLVLRRVIQEGDGCIESALHGTDAGSTVVDLIKGRIQLGDRISRRRSRSQGQGTEVPRSHISRGRDAAKIGRRSTNGKV